MKAKLLACKIEDIGQLAELSLSTFRDAFEDANDPEDFETYLKSAFSKDRLRAQVENPHSKFYFIYFEDAIVGYLKINLGIAQSDIGDDCALELERIYISKEFQGKQLGSWALNEILQLAKTYDKKYVWLGVWEQNQRAIKFYERIGFQKFGEHPYFIGSDKQTDWLLRYDLK